MALPVWLRQADTEPLKLALGEKEGIPEPDSELWPELLPQSDPVTLADTDTVLQEECVPPILPETLGEGEAVFSKVAFALVVTVAQLLGVEARLAEEVAQAEEESVEAGEREASPLALLLTLLSCEAELQAVLEALADRHSVALLLGVVSTVAVAKGELETLGVAVSVTLCEGLPEGVPELLEVDEAPTVAEKLPVRLAVKELLCVTSGVALLLLPIDREALTDTLPVAHTLADGEPERKDVAESESEELALALVVAVLCPLPVAPPASEGVEVGVAAADAESLPEAVIDAAGDVEALPAPLTVPELLTEPLEEARTVPDTEPLIVAPPEAEALALGLNGALRVASPVALCAAEPDMLRVDVAELEREGDMEAKAE